MKAFLIDPVAQTVEQLDFGWDGKDYSRLIRMTCELIEADTIDFCRPNLDTGPVRLSIALHDTGLTDRADQLWQILGYPQPLAGKGLALGEDRYGETVPAPIDLDRLRFAVQFEPELICTGIDTLNVTGGVEFRPRFARKPVNAEAGNG